jgi:hypothetical protein
LVVSHTAAVFVVSHPADEPPAQQAAFAGVAAGAGGLTSLTTTILSAASNMTPKMMFLSLLFFLGGQQSAPSQPQSFGLFTFSGFFPGSKFSSMINVFWGWFFTIQEEL